MLQFLTIVGAVLVAMVLYTVIAFALMTSKFYYKWVMKICKKMYNVDDL